MVGAGAHIEIAGPLHIFAGAPDHHGGQPGRIGELFSGEDVGRRAARLLRRGVVVIGLDAGEAQAGQGRLDAGIGAAQVGRAAEGHGGCGQLVTVDRVVLGEPAIIPGEGHVRYPGDAGADLGGPGPFAC